MVMKAQVKKSVKAALLPEAIAPREVVANCDHLMKRILNIRGKMVMVDRDIADLYKVPTKRLNEQVRPCGSSARIAASPRFQAKLPLNERNCRGALQPPVKKKAARFL